MTTRTDPYGVYSSKLLGLAPYRLRHRVYRPTEGSPRDRVPLHALADLGEAEILATVVSSKNPWSPACVAAVNTYYGRPELPVGQPKATDVLHDDRPDDGADLDHAVHAPDNSAIPSH